MLIMLAKLCGFPFPFLEYSKWVEMDVLWMRCSVLCRMHKRDFEVGREWLWQLGLWRSPRLGFQTPMMMMIAFITIKSSLVPSIWVLYAENLFWIWDIGGLAFTSLAFLFRKKNMFKKKAVIARSHPTSWHIHTHVYFVHIYETRDMYAKI